MKGLIVVLDEFTYLLQTDAAFPSILQRLWDKTLQHSRLMVILRSYAGIMKPPVLAYQAPLYRRRTGQWHLQPLTFADARLFLPGYGTPDRVRAFAILGGYRPTCASLPTADRCSTTSKRRS